MLNIATMDLESNECAQIYHHLNVQRPEALAKLVSDFSYV